jgi:prepilin-type N-terminal cleavage/methylation domain-containing protein
MKPYDYSKKIKSSFALIELLVAVAIFGVVASTVYTALYTGINVYHRAKTELGLNQEVNQILDRLSLELRNCYDAEYDEGRDSSRFIGQERNLSFFTMKDIYTKDGLNKTIARCSYRFSEGKLLKQTKIGVDALADNQDIEEEELMAGISLLFSNTSILKIFEEGEYPYEWKSEWQDKMLIPAGIKVEMVKLDPEKNLT